MDWSKRPSHTIPLYPCTPPHFTRKWRFRNPCGLMRFVDTNQVRPGGTGSRCGSADDCDSRRIQRLRCLRKQALQAQVLLLNPLEAFGLISLHSSVLFAPTKVCHLRRAKNPAHRLIGLRFSDVAGGRPTHPLRSGGFMRFMQHRGAETHMAGSLAAFALAAE